MRRMVRGLVAVMENEQLDQAEQSIKPNDEVVADPVLDVVELDENPFSSEENIEEEMDQTNDIIEALESIYEIFSNVSKTGDVKIENAAVVNVAVESMLNVSGIKLDKKLISLESFSTDSQRSISYNFAMESIVDSIKKAWDILIQAMKKIFEWFKTFFSKIFNSAEKTLANAEELKKKLPEYKNQKMTKEKMENTHIFNKLNIEGEVIVNLNPFLKNMEDTYSSVVKTTISTYESFKKNIDGFYKLQSVFGQVINGELSISKLMNIEIKKVELLGADKIDNPHKFDSSFPEKLNTNLASYKTKDFLGNKTIVCVVPDQTLSGDNAYKVMNQIKSKLVDNTEGKTFEPKEIPVLTYDVMSVIIDTVIAVCKSIISFKEKESEIEKQKSKLLSEAESLKNMSMDYRNLHIRKSIQQAIHIAKFIASSIDQPITAMTSYCLSTSIALMDYVKSSLKLYGTGKELANT